MKNSFHCSARKPFQSSSHRVALFCFHLFVLAMQRNRMGKKMRLPFLLKHSEIKSSSCSWPPCNQPRTLSFRTKNEVFKTFNSAYIDATLDLLETPDPSFFTNSSTDSTGLSTASENSERREDTKETMVRGLRSERLFFDPEETSSILQSKATPGGLPFKEIVILSLDSKDPFVDFRKSMKEMVEAHGVNSSEGLKELLSLFLRVNGKSNHGYIVGAFVDLTVGLAMSGSCSRASPGFSHSPASLLSFYASLSSSSLSTHCVSCFDAGEESESTPPCNSMLEEKLCSETNESTTSSNV